MNKVKVDGKKVMDILVYALSTCVWCKKTKKFLTDLGISYEYIDVDLLDTFEREKIEEEIKKYNPSVSFPTIVFDKKDSIIGYEPEKIKRRLEL